MHTKTQDLIQGFKNPINQLLIIFVILSVLASFILKHFNHPFLSNCLLGITGSMIASICLVNVYDAFKVKNIKIVAILLLFQQLNNFIIIVLNSFQNIYYNMDKFQPESNECEIRKSLINDIDKILEKIISPNLNFNLSGDLLAFCGKRGTIDNTKFPYATIKLNKVQLEDYLLHPIKRLESILTTYWKILNDEELIDAFANLIFKISKRSNQYCIFKGNSLEIEIKSLSEDSLLLIIEQACRCYQCINMYKIDIEKYLNQDNENYNQSINEQMVKYIRLNNLA